MQFLKIITSNYNQFVLRHVVHTLFRIEPIATAVQLLEIV